MGIQQLKERLPDYAKDIKLNLSNIVLETEGMTEQQLWGAMLAAAIATKHPLVIEEVARDAEAHLSEQARQAAKAAAAIMGMNNVYYRSLHQLANKEYSRMPAKLRMNVIGNPGVEKLDFELWELTCSAVNGCAACLDSHERVLTSKGIAREIVLHALRIAAVMHAVAVVLTAEQALTVQTPIQ
ncbi:MAG: alkyl hydroperoxide reductase [Candidatus Sumerlaeia bacterium]